MEISLVYNVVLISAVQQSGSVIQTPTSAFKFFSIMIYHTVQAPCVTQWDLVVYPPYI